MVTGTSPCLVAIQFHSSGQARDLSLSVVVTTLEEMPQWEFGGIGFGKLGDILPKWEIFVGGHCWA
jgi:hypothetical protein